MRTVSAILRDMDNVNKAQIKDHHKAKFIAQLEAELEQIAHALPEPQAGATPAPPAPTKKGA